MRRFRKRGHWVIRWAVCIIGVLGLAFTPPVWADEVADALKAVEAIDDDELLGFIAMGLFRNLMGYSDDEITQMELTACVLPEEAHLAALKRTRSPHLLMACASFTSGEVYRDPAYRTNQLTYKGKTHTIQRM